jgi:hypothetical protein
MMTGIVLGVLALVVIALLIWCLACRDRGEGVVAEEEEARYEGRSGEEDRDEGVGAGKRAQAKTDPAPVGRKTSKKHKVAQNSGGGHRGKNHRPLTKPPAAQKGGVEQDKEEVPLADQDERGKGDEPASDEPQRGEEAEAPAKDDAAPPAEDAPAPAPEEPAAWAPAEAEPNFQVLE